jgi:hypothetical protein
MANPYAANIAINSASGKQVSNLLDLEDDVPQNNLGDLGLDYDLGAGTNRGPVSPPFQQKSLSAAPGAVALPGLASTASIGGTSYLPTVSPANNSKAMHSMPIQPTASSVVNDLASLNLGSATTTAATHSGLDGTLFNMSSQQSFVSPKTMFLSAQNGKGLEIMGTCK